MMSRRLSFAPCLLAGGILLALLGLVLWRTLPIALAFPPFFITAVLAMVFAGAELWRDRRRSRKKDSPPA